MRAHVPGHSVPFSKAATGESADSPKPWSGSIRNVPFSFHGGTLQSLLPFISGISEYSCEDRQLRVIYGSHMVHQGSYVLLPVGPNSSLGAAPGRRCIWQLPQVINMSTIESPLTVVTIVCHRLQSTCIGVAETCSSTVFAGSTHPNGCCTASNTWVGTLD